MSTPTPHLKLTKPDKLEQFSTALINNNYDIIDTFLNRMPKGIQVRDTVDGTSVPIINRAVINHFPAVTFKKDRQYVIELNGAWHTNNTDSHLSLEFIKDPNLAAAGANLTGTLTPAGSYLANFYAHRTYAYQKFTHKILYLPTVDETVQIKLVAQRGAGTGSLFLANFQWWVEDKGLV